MAYARKTSKKSSIPVPGGDPGIFPCGVIAKVNGGGTYTFYVPWDYCKFTYADSTETTVTATEDLVITITVNGVSVGTITVGYAAGAIGTFDEIASLVTANCSLGDTITITTTNSSNAGAAFVRLYFEPVAV